MRKIAIVVGLATLLASACAGAPEPEALREGRSIYGGTCSVCHGDRGQGGTGPALDGVIETWPSCSDQIEWIEVGSEGWLEQHGESYGATGKPVTGGMPAHGDQLELAEIRKVAAFQRVEYGGDEANAALADCGVTE